MKRDEQYVERRVMEMKLQWRGRRRKKIWLDRVRDDTKRKGTVRGRNCTNVLHGGVCHRASTPHKVGIRLRRRSSVQMR